MIIRPAREDEHRTVYNIAKRSKYTRDFSNQMMFSSAKAYAKGFIRVMVKDDEIIGFTCFRVKTRDKSTVLYFIGVDEAHRGEGLGTELVEDLIALDPHGCVELNVMRDNAPAIAMYGKLGFRIVGEALNGEGVKLARGNYAPKDPVNRPVRRAVVPRRGSDAADGNSRAAPRPEPLVRQPGPVIINIRGTSGSGKSTLVRRVLADYPSKLRVKMQKRRQPIGYLLSDSERAHMLAVPGHYETACGGCDTINGLDDIYGHVQRARDSGMNVLFEGLIVCSDYKRLVELHERYGNVVVIGLTTPIEECVSSVEERRRVGGNEKALDPTNTQAKHRTNERVLERFSEAGVPVEWLDREAALARVMELLS